MSRHASTPQTLTAPAPAATQAPATAPAPDPGPRRGIGGLIPGIALCAAGIALAFAISTVTGPISALMIAIVLGMLMRNTIRVPDLVEPGIAFSAKHLLRAGIVVLGLQLAIGDILALGWGVLLLVVAVVVIGLASSLAMGSMLGLSRPHSLLIGCGFSICGAAAVAGADGVIQDKKEEEVVSAVALVVVFGTIMIPLLPLMASAIGFTTDQTAMWAGASVHEVAQVVAIGGALGGAALGAAVIVKLARVLVLAPVMAGIAIVERRRLRQRGADASATTMPPVMPMFVALFIVAVILRSILPMPQGLLDAASLVQTLLLGAAMFGLGAGVKLSMFRRLGLRPVILALGSTVAVTVVGGLGAALLA
ncbi:YeiH family protein [Helcobacillus massiliensis]|uniref:Putative integral membrane protein (TIGR00698 family) n=1 Tax=Helcobacillus massiliensis TaxID=521392 RepID=A0A839QQL2_9MICO|nr:putative sulfate exporter family transporter [Helcobacillus massiliensis]MBB3022065.1 putative integral membrane protein (TIGR00698 family) [Helcobacillus massiliensis]